MTSLVLDATRELLHNSATVSLYRRILFEVTRKALSLP